MFCQVIAVEEEKLEIKEKTLPAGQLAAERCTLAFKLQFGLLSFYMLVLISGPQVWPGSPA